MNCLSPVLVVEFMQTADCMLSTIKLAGSQRIPQRETKMFCQLHSSWRRETGHCYFHRALSGTTALFFISPRNLPQFCEVKRFKEECEETF